MAFDSARLKITFDCGMGDEGKTILMSKSYSDVHEGASEEKIKEVANAIADLCKHEKSEVLHIVSNNITH